MIEAEFICAYCGEVNATTVDPSGGRSQSYVEDCQVCCRPNVLTIEIEAGEPSEAFIDAARES